MANPLPPPPTKSPDGSYAWLDWYRKLQQYVSQGGSVPWNVIDFTNSNLADIAIKDHNVLNNIQGGTTGEFYHLTSAEHANALIAVPNTRNLTAGAGLIGGGNLTIDRTFDIVANGDGSIVVNPNDIQVGVLATDTQHGVRGGGTQHAVATTASAGFMSAADKTTFDGMGTFQSSSSTGTALTSGVNTNVASLVSLPAGDWDVEGVVLYLPAATTTVTNLAEGPSSTSATFGSLGSLTSLATSFTTGAAQRRATSIVRFNLGSATTIFLVAQATFGVSTMTADGFIRARRARV